MNTEWTGKTRVSRCGLNKWGNIDRGFCGETFTFREAQIGIFGRIPETICSICSLKWDIMASTSFSERYRLCEVLAKVMNTDAYSAFCIAKASFHFNDNHCPPVRPLTNGHSNGKNGVIMFMDRYQQQGYRAPQSDP
jgi:hypothetical protein